MTIKQSVCEWHPSGGLVIHCAHLGNRFVAITPRSVGGYFVDYIEDLDGGGVVAEGHYIPESGNRRLEFMFNAILLKMHGDIAPNPDDDYEDYI